MSYKRLIPSIFLYQGKAVQWIDERKVLASDPVLLARDYAKAGADGLLIFDLSDTDEDHEESVDLIRRIHRRVSPPLLAGGNIKRLEDVKKYLYAGAKQAVFNLSKADAAPLLQEVSQRFGKERICASVMDFDGLFKQQRLIEEYSSCILFMHRVDMNSVPNVTKLPYLVLTDTLEEGEIVKLLKNEGLSGLSGRFVSRPGFSFETFKETCEEAEGIQFSTFESLLDFEQLKPGPDGLVPVIVQDYKSNQVLMLAYMNREAFEHTLKSGRMTYYSRSRKQQWVKGETSGHFQYMKSLTADCDMDTLLAKVEQIGPACHTGSPTCFFQPVTAEEYQERNPIQVFEAVYNTIEDRRLHPKEGSYTNYLFEKGLDKILKKVGEESTELVIAAKNPNPEELKYEMADLLYHAMVLMVEKGISWEDITQELSRR